MSNINNLIDPKAAFERKRRFWQFIRNAAAITTVVAGIVFLVLLFTCPEWFENLISSPRAPVPTREIASNPDQSLRLKLNDRAMNFINKYQEKTGEYFCATSPLPKDSNDKTLNALIASVGTDVEVLRDYKGPVLRSQNYLYAYYKKGETDLSFKIVLPAKNTLPTILEIVGNLYKEPEVPDKESIKSWELTMDIKIIKVIAIPGNMYDEDSVAGSLAGKFREPIICRTQYKGPTPLSGNQLISYYKNGDMSKIYFMILQPFEV